MECNLKECAHNANGICMNEDSVRQDLYYFGYCIDAKRLTGNQALPKHRRPKKCKPRIRITTEEKAVIETLSEFKEKLLGNKNANTDYIKGVVDCSMAVLDCIKNKKGKENQCIQ